MARNKSHKQRFSSKRQLADKTKGRQVPVTRPKGVKAMEVSNSKERLKQTASALRNKREQAAKDNKRLGNFKGIPRIIGFIPANESGNTEELVGRVCGSLSAEPPKSNDPFTVVSKERKCAFTFVYEKNCNDQDCIDVAKVSDIIVLVLDASQTVRDTIREIQETRGLEDEDLLEAGTIATTWFSDVGLCITDYTRDIVTALNSQGSPNVVVALQNLHTFTERQQQKVLKLHSRYFISMLNDTTKVVSIIGEEDVESMVRHMQVCKVRQLKWRDQRPYFPVEATEYNEETRQLTICGRLRGMPLAATQLMHLTNHGTFQISSIYTIKGNGETEIIDTSTEEQRESLQQVQANSTLDDGGLPTEADVAFAQQSTHKLRVPAGTSEYAAAWYDYEENYVQDDEEGNGDKKKKRVQIGGEVVDEGPMSAYPTSGSAMLGDAEGNDDDDDFRPQHITIMDDEDAFMGDAMSYRTTQTDVDFLKVADIIRLERMTDEERAMEVQQLKKKSEEEVWNSDMVDTPVNLPARQRFAKYRGLKSFATSKWDPAENLPPQYAYIFKLQGYNRIRQAAVAKCDEGPAEIGQLIYVTLEDVPPAVAAAQQDSCLLIASGQLEHEQKWSVVHFQVQRASDFDEPIKSKTPMLAHVGFRKFYVSPLFSDLSAGDRTKFARFFHEGDKFRLASFFGPISYNPCPILLFQVPSLEEQAEGNPLRLACFGGGVPPNPDLLLLKRTVLSGRIAVIHKKQIVVKYMFFNDEDIRWFQPVDLYTRFGRRGKITKAVGTHGLFKAQLNDQVMQHDVVCMDLYKRVFPRWTTVPFNISEMVGDNDEEAEAEEKEAEFENEED